TIVLELIQKRPTYHRRLCGLRLMLPTLDQLARELKSNHEDWKKTLTEVTPGRDPFWIASDALERAIQELQDRLPSESTETEDAPRTPHAARAFLPPPPPTE